MMEKRVRICSHCRKEHNRRRRYCSDECKRAAMAANRVMVHYTCRDCGKPTSRETSVTCSRPEKCGACLHAAAVAAQRAWRARRNEEAEMPGEQLAGELERSRLRLACEFESYRARVRKLAADLGIQVGLDTRGVVMQYRIINATPRSEP